MVEGSGRSEEGGGGRRKEGEGGRSREEEERGQRRRREEEDTWSHCPCISYACQCIHSCHVCCNFNCAFIHMYIQYVCMYCTFANLFRYVSSPSTT